MLNSDWPKFIIQAYRPMVIIKISGGVVFAMDMLDGELDTVNIPALSQKANSISEPVFIAYETGPNYFKALNEKTFVEHTVYYNSDYRLHREDGPAHITNDKIRTEKTFWLNGTLYSNKEEWFENLPDKKKAIFNLDEIV